MTICSATLRSHHGHTFKNKVLKNISDLLFVWYTNHHTVEYSIPLKISDKSIVGGLYWPAVVCYGGINGVRFYRIKINIQFNKIPIKIHILFLTCFYQQQKTPDYCLCFPSLSLSDWTKRNMFHLVKIIIIFFKNELFLSMIFPINPSLFLPVVAIPILPIYSLMYDDN